METRQPKVEMNDELEMQVPSDEELEARLDAFLEGADPDPLGRPEVQEMLLRRAADRCKDSHD